MVAKLLGVPIEFKGRDLEYMRDTLLERWAKANPDFNADRESLVAAEFSLNLETDADMKAFIALMNYRTSRTIMFAEWLKANYPECAWIATLQEIPVAINELIWSR